MSVANLRLKVADIMRYLNENYSLDIGLTIVKQSFHNENLFGTRPSKNPLISARNVKAHFEFAQKYKN